MSQEIQSVLEEIASERELGHKYGPAVLQAAIIVELRKLRAAIEKTSSPLVPEKVRKKPGPKPKVRVETSDFVPARAAGQFSEEEIKETQKLVEASVNAQGFKFGTRPQGS